MNKDALSVEAQAMYLLQDDRLLMVTFGLELSPSLLRLWEYPSFDPYKVWFICQKINKRQGSQKEYLVLCVEWDRKADLYEEIPHEVAVNTPRLPRFTFQNAPLAESFVEEIISALRSIQIPLFLPPSDYAVLDGVRFGVEYEESLTSIRLDWSFGGRDEWNHLTQWHTKVRTFLEDALKSQNE